MAERKATTPLRPHRLKVDFEPAVPRYWLSGRRVETQLANALGILFPLGERLFVRSAREALPSVEDEQLRAQVKGFIAQEVHHAYQHERSFRVLENQGYSPRKLAQRIERMVRRQIEPRLGFKGRIAVTAALEHFTATFSEFAFDSGIFDGADETMRELYLWHAAEEIEHKCVAFDLLQAVDDSYRLRVLGMAFVAPVFLSLWYGTTTLLVLGEKPRDPLGAFKEWLSSATQGRLALREMAVAIADYLDPHFHPAEHDNFDRAREFFAARAKAAATDRASAASGSRSPS